MKCSIEFLSEVKTFRVQQNAGLENRFIYYPFVYCKSFIYPHIHVTINEEKPAGKYEVKFCGRNLTGEVYFYQLKAGFFIETKKLVLIN